MVARIGSWRDNNLQIKCAREAVKLIKSYILEGTSFNQETTLSGKSIINNIKVAKEKGFYIVMNYIGWKEALLEFYNSRTYNVLEQEETKLWYEGASYLYMGLEREKSGEEFDI